MWGYRAWLVPLIADMAVENRSEGKKEEEKESRKASGEGKTVILVVPPRYKRRGGSGGFVCMSVSALVVEFSSQERETDLRSRCRTDG